MADSKQELFRNIPSVTAFLESPSGQSLVESFGHGITKLLLRELLDEIRRNIGKGEIQGVPTIEALGNELETRLERLTSPVGRRAINATGILLHTGLGRAPLADSALDQLGVFGGYSVLQTDLETGKRCLRETRIEKMLTELTGCEAATVVNNNAAATMLVLNTVAEGKEAIVSRGQLIEIGGAFRMPDVMEKSQAILREIGTTNRTHLRDYEAAITEETGAMIHVHTSNYRVRGFSGTPNIEEICELRKKFPEVSVVDDLGSGALVPLNQWRLPNEPLVKASIAAGSDLICFSGDKLICGPQCGIICGRKELVDKVRKNPYARMFRVCKMTLAVLESTLVHFVNDTYRDALPFYRMLSYPIDDLMARAEQLAGSLQSVPGITVEIIDDLAYIGSGSIPDEGVASKVVKISGMPSLDKTAKALRCGLPSVFGRVGDDSLLFDMRSLLPDDFSELLRVLPAVLADGAGE